MTKKTIVVKKLEWVIEGKEYSAHLRTETKTGIHGEGRYGSTPEQAEARLRASVDCGNAVTEVK